MTVTVGTAIFGKVDEDFLYLEAYDSSDALLASATEVLPWDLEGGKTISVTAASDVKYVKFWGEGLVRQNSVVFDNFSFTAVPEPVSMFLFGLGGISFGLFGKLRRKK